MPEAEKVIMKDGKYVEDTRTVEMRVTTKRMSSPAGGTLLSRGDSFKATEPEAVSLIARGLAVRSADYVEPEEAETEPAAEGGDEKGSEKKAAAPTLAHPHQVKKK